MRGTRIEYTRNGKSRALFEFETIKCTNELCKGRGFYLEPIMPRNAPVFESTTEKHLCTTCWGEGFVIKGEKYNYRYRDVENWLAGGADCEIHHYARY